MSSDSTSALLDGLQEGESAKEEDGGGGGGGHAEEEEGDADDASYVAQVLLGTC